MKKNVFLEQPEAAMSVVAFRADPKLRRWLTFATCALVIAVGFADFHSGTEASLQVFYIIPVVFAVIAGGWRFGAGISVACVTIWVGGDVAAGARYSSFLVPIWNAAITLTTYLVLVWLLSSLLRLKHDLERRVEQRTQALAREITERERLEKSILEISERERRSIGHDLHDGLGQHLTGTAITGQLLADRLQERMADETDDARRVVSLIKTAIAQTRQMAKGLLLADINAEGLSEALLEFCTTSTAHSRVICTFNHQESIESLPSGDGVSNHLFRIVQEAVRNAIRHGRAKHIDVRLHTRNGILNLEVQDDGTGLPLSTQQGEGLGLRIMAHRAQMIGAIFAIECPTSGGTIVRCQLPLSPHE